MTAAQAVVEAPRHPWKFLLRRGANWLPLGLAYASLYQARYALNVAQSALSGQMSKEDFGTIFAIGALVYSVSFLKNGPMTDRRGGRYTMLLGVFGALVANAFIGLVLYGRAMLEWNIPLYGSLVVLYSANMYFQSFAAAAIVTTKAPWFHVRERGRFSTVFGYMIALGIFFAFDWGSGIIGATRATSPKDALGFWVSIFSWFFGPATGVNRDWWLFFTPAITLGVEWVVIYLLVRNRPSEAGFNDFVTGDDSLSQEGEELPVREIFRRIITHPVFKWVCVIEFCSGVMRNGSLQWYPKLAEALGFKKTFFVTQNWGLMMLICGIVGGTLTGWLSDKLFQSRRAPMVVILYSLMLVCSILLAATLTSDPQIAGYLILVIVTSVIGVHSIKAGTVTADFGGRNTGSAVAIVDGMVYLGTSLQSFATGQLVPANASNPANWIWWATLFIPFAAIGAASSYRIWDALPKAAKTRSAEGATA